MPPARMHEDELVVDEHLVRRLVAGQLPHLAHLPVRRFASTGTVNAIIRLGDDLYARLPRVAAWADDLVKELEWLPRLAPALPLTVPEPVAVGRPTDAFPHPWAIFRWVPGSPYAVGAVDEVTAARRLAGFVSALREVAVPVQAPAGGRRPLAELDAATRDALERSRHLVDADAALAAWDRARQAPAFDPLESRRVWLHGDLLPPNVLVNGGHLAAVLDFGSLGVGDPAADAIAAWTMFTRAGRTAYREALGVDDATWERARGYALTQAALIVPYYEHSNPDFSAMARRTIAMVLEDARDVGNVLSQSDSAR
ncbi:aminoglycoside phosphotransferase family protein [Terrabacter sp. 2RAF25]|uniref:aminoglycoside phosphotransferase family protein n=1 Tax=Terrabacter sp. 2RAF25 TaxID=3232998 RepID=UPI003F99E332